jgi:transposase-like protein
VLSGKAAYKTIARELGINESTVQRSMKWLDQNRWLDIFIKHDARGYLAPYTIRLRLDVTGHTERENDRQVGQAVVQILDGNLPARRRAK